MVQLVECMSSMHAVPSLIPNMMAAHASLALRSWKQEVKVIFDYTASLRTACLKKLDKVSLGVMVHTFNPRTWETDKGRSLLVYASLV